VSEGATGRRGRRWFRVAAILVALVVLLFVATGLDPRWRTPRSGTTGPTHPDPRPPSEIRILAFNAAKFDFYAGGFRFAGADAIRSRLAVLADAIRRERIDLCFLSEVVMEAGPGSIDQVEELAKTSGLLWWASGENYRFGWPFLCIRSGNALLTRFPMEALSVEPLPGTRPYWNPTGRRRVLWCDLEIAGEKILAGSIRNDSFDLVNNLAQTRVLLERSSARPAILAGDFNAEPDTDSIHLLVESGRFSPAISGGPTYPAEAPHRRIDHVFAPKGWELVEERTLEIGASDHLAVLAVYRLPATSAPR
jgi:endonuclease/exonuclease/phosphatase family metal-dependent hydrolase